MCIHTEYPLQCTPQRHAVYSLLTNTLEILTKTPQNMLQSFLQLFILFFSHIYFTKIFNILFLAKLKGINIVIFYNILSRAIQSRNPLWSIKSVSLIPAMNPNYILQLICSSAQTHQVKQFDFPTHVCISSSFFLSFFFF